MLLVTERFVALAKAVSKGEGVANQPMLEIPGNPEFYGEAELSTTVAGMIDELAKLVAPTVRR